MINAINNIACLWWNWMAAMFWQVSLLIILIACIDTIIKRWAWPQLRYALWLLVLLKLVLPPGISMQGSLTGRLQTQFDRVISRNINEPSTITQYSPFIVVSESIVPVRAITSQPPATFEIQLSEPDIETSAEVMSESPSVRLVWQFYAFLLWLLGMTALGLWLISRLYHLRACQSRKGPADSMPQSFHRTLSQCAQQLKLRRVPRIVVTKKVVCPAVFGIFRPVLLMPKGYLSKLSRKGAEHMLLHELAHIKRGDTILHSFYLFLQIVYWFNPLLWLARRQLIHLRELCCDATVARILKNKTNEYRQTLIDIARRFLTKPVEPGLGLLGLFEDTNRLLVRLSWLEKKTWRYQKMKNLIIITIVTLMLVFVLPMAKAHEQPSAEDNTVQSEHTQESLSQEVSGQETELEFMEAKDKYLQALQILLATYEKQSLQTEEKDKYLQALQTLLAKYEEQYLHKELVDEEDFYQELKKTRDELDNKLATAYELEKKQLTDEKVFSLYAFLEQEKNQSVDEEKSSLDKEKLQDELVNSETKKQILLNELAVLEISQIDAEETEEKLSDAQITKIKLILENDYLQALQTLIDKYEKRSLQNKLTLLRNLHLNAENAEEQDDKFVATREMEFITKIQPDAGFVVQNNVGNIVLSPSQDGNCTVKAVIRATAETDKKAQELVELVSMSANSTNEHFYFEPVKSGGDEWNNLSVDLYITVPSGVDLNISTDVGSIEISNLHGRITGTSDVGSIKAVNITGEIKLTMNVGNIEFVAPNDFSAQFQANTKVGSIESEFPLDINAVTMSGNMVMGTIGSGENNVSLTTETGTIFIKKQSSADN